MFNFNEEQKLLAKMVSDFATKELAPKAAQIDEEEGFNADAFKTMASLGLLGITVSDEYGGSTLGAVEATLTMEKMATI